MERFISKDEGSRLYFSYENFMDPISGPGEAVRLANFLAAGLKHDALDWVMNSMEDGGDDGGGTEEHPIDALLRRGGEKGGGDGGDGGNDISPKEVIDMALSEATRSMVKVEEVPCVWREVVHSTIAAPSSTLGKSEEDDRKRRSIVDDEEEHRLLARNWNSAERPYSPENLAEISQMLLELMNRWNRHQRLLTILAVYHREVNRAYLEITGQLDGAIVKHDELYHAQQEKPPQQPQQQPTVEGLSVPPQGSFHVIQASHPSANVASIIASNWLMGMFEPKKDIAFMNFNWPDEPIKQSGLDAVIDSNLVTKTNKVDLLTLYKLIRREFITGNVPMSVLTIFAQRARNSIAIYLESKYSGF
jgi:hypothetical protein